MRGVRQFLRLCVVPSWCRLVKSASHAVFSWLLSAIIMLFYRLVILLFQIMPRGGLWVILRVHFSGRGGFRVILRVHFSGRGGLLVILRVHFSGRGGLRVILRGRFSGRGGFRTILRGRFSGRGGFLTILLLRRGESERRAASACCGIRSRPPL